MDRPDAPLGVLGASEPARGGGHRRQGAPHVDGQFVRWVAERGVERVGVGGRRGAHGVAGVVQHAVGGGAVGDVELVTDRSADSLGRLLGHRSFPFAVHVPFNPTPYHRPPTGTGPTVSGGPWTVVHPSSTTGQIVT